MKASLSLALVCIALSAGAAVAQNPECDAAYECAYTYTDLTTSTIYHYDLSSLCASTDYIMQDTVGHTYYSNVCGKAKQKCLPKTWTNIYEYGVAVQTWGATPACPPQDCNDPSTGNPVCCTADCQVLGTGNPYWYLSDSSNPETGGLVARFKGAAASDSDPFWCDFNPATGAQYEREVHMMFACDSSVSTIAMINAEQNHTNDCRYYLHFSSSLACAGGGGMSGGWVFILVLFILAVVYLVVGAVMGYVQKKVWELPNKEFWSEFGDLVRAGIAFTASGFKKGGGSYDDISASGGGGSGGATYTSSSYQGGSAPATTGGGGSKEAYTDL